LEYSESSERTYCLYCFVFSKNIKKRSGFDVFTAQGFDSWKKVHDKKNCAFLTHIGFDPCSVHNNGVKECHTLLHQPNHISNVFVVTSDLVKERDRLRLRTTMAVVQWLTSQSCALRGHEETPESKNRGNFIELVKLLAEFNPEIANVVLENAPLNAKYTSPNIQNEILSIIAMKIRKHIHDEVRDAKFSILVDETCDVSKRE
jgi:hypothetical protein